MLRIIDMRKATCGERDFSVWDTVTDRFLEINGEQSFDGLPDFLELFDAGNHNMSPGVRDRIQSLIPEWATG